MNRASFARLKAWGGEPPRPRDGTFVALGGLFLRLLVVVWAASRFPPAEDGKYYDIVAGRIARGLGYTWLWPDGAVTYAAHYPVGYPALIAALYAVLGPRPIWAMAFNAILGAASVMAVHRLASTEANRAGAILAAILIAVHPGLLFYTPALMTEGVSAALLALAAWASIHSFRDASRPWRRTALVGGIFGVATLVRPQSLLLSPWYGALLSAASFRKRCLAAAGTALVAVLLCLPWTIRNCNRMKSCVLVSANAGWNLFIGAAEGATGTWVSLDELGVPAACRTVWGEADKDACFGKAAWTEIRDAPQRFVALIPKKLGATFDYAGAAGWYLHSSNPSAFGERDKVVLGVAETIWERLILLAALCSLASRGPRREARLCVVVLSGLALLSRAAWIAHVGLVVVGLFLGRRLVDRPAAAIATATVLGTAFTHAVFFGAGRYSLVCFPALAALGGTVLTRREEPEDTVLSKE